MTHSFEIGDHVFVGKPSPHKVHWVVIAPPTDALPAVLRSPMSGRTRVVPASDLAPYAEGIPA